MKSKVIRFANKNQKYQIIIGNNILRNLPKKINSLCPKAKKIALIVDKNVPNKFKVDLKKILKKYELLLINFTANEKAKSLKTVNTYLDKILSKNYNKSDLIISVGGGITGDVAGFISSIFKRGINFINIPTTLLAQVDSAVGGKTGVNSKQGKNLIGSFYQPKLVISDTSFLKSLSRKEIICGYAEILKHSIIKDKKFFHWLKVNTQKILSRETKELVYAIAKSIKIKIFFVSKDINEKGLRMTLNFGHTFAHAIEAQNNYSKKIAHGEAVLSGMILESRLSVLKKICSKNTLSEITDIYKKSNLAYTFNKFNNQNSINKLVPYLKNDKKNNDNKINFILLKKIGQTTKPNACKISIDKIKRYSKFICQY